MALFDMLKSKAKAAVTQTVRETVTKAAQNIGNKTEKIVFGSMPSSVEEFKALPQAALSTPFETAAMTVLALSCYPQSKELCFEMLNYLRGPRPLSGMDKQFISDRFMYKDYVPRSYFAGATPENDYRPSMPLTVSVSENPHSYEAQGYAKLFIPSGGADNPRPVQLREAKDGKWYLWEQFLLPDIRQPESFNPWA